MSSATWFFPSLPATNANAFAQGSESDETIQRLTPSGWIASLTLAMTTVGFGTTSKSLVVRRTNEGRYDAITASSFRLNFARRLNSSRHQARTGAIRV
jgi:hypothetical protein